MKPSDFFDQAVSLFDDRKFDFEISQALSRTEEWSQLSARDEWQNWDVQFSRASDVEKPWIDDLARNEVRPTWPGEAPFAVCVTHDIDTLDHFSWSEYRVRLARASGLKKLKTLLGFIKNRLILRKSNAWSFETWLALEQKFGVRATWYVPPEAPLNPDQDDCSYAYSDLVSWSAQDTIPFRTALQRLVSVEGHEVGLHGSISAHADSAELLRQRLALAEVLGTSVTGLRMHYLKFDPLKSPGAVAAAGFETDSTYGFNRAIGFRAGTSFPHRMFDPIRQKTTTVVEVPFCIQDGSLFRTWCLNLDAQAARERSSSVFDAVAAVNGVVNLVFHPNHANEPLILSYFEWCLEELHKRGACFLTVRDAAKAILPS